MALKAKIDQTAYNALSEPVREFYKQEGQDYVLDVEGSPAGAQPPASPSDGSGSDEVLTLRNKINEFRTNNNAYKEQVATLEAQLAEAQSAASAGENKSKTLQEQVADLQSRFEQSESARQQAAANAARATFERVMGDVAQQAGVVPGAVIDIRTRAASAGFKAAEDGQSVVGPNGQTVEQWMTQLRASGDAAHMFAQPSVTGVAGRATPNMAVRVIDGPKTPQDLDDLATGKAELAR